MEKVKSVARSLYARVKYALCYDVNILHRTAYTLFSFSLGGITIWVVFIFIPYLYNDGHSRLGTFMQFFGFFMASQIGVNWLCMKFVDCSYHPDIHGTIPDDIKIGQNVSRIRDVRALDSSNGENNNGAALRKRLKGGPKNGSVMYVATEMPKPGENPKRTQFPYFSWTPCLRCNRPRPPRCHHCPLCNKCVLKRDHHCFFVNSCIGYRNLRHFSVFIFWSFFSTVFSACHALPYCYFEVISHIRVVDFIFPVSILRAIFGYIQYRHSFFIVITWLIFIFIAWSFSFLLQIFTWITGGRTSFEIDNKMIIEDTRPLSGKLKSVFGRFWALNFLLPLHFAFEPIEDPVEWPSIRA